MSVQRNLCILWQCFLSVNKSNIILLMLRQFTKNRFEHAFSVLQKSSCVALKSRAMNKHGAFNFAHALALCYATIQSREQ